MNPACAELWQKLTLHARELSDKSLNDLFATDATRVDTLSFMQQGMRLDLSKQHLTPQVLTDLLRLAEASGVSERIRAMFRGELINTTEKRPALHVALRRPSHQALYCNGEDVMPAVHTELDKMRAFVRKVHSGAWRGATDEKITDVVNIGIGGSDLGPRLVADALQSAANNAPQAHFVSNLDSADLQRTLNRLNPATTLFVIVSKTFTTLETLSNAQLAKAWLQKHLGNRAEVAAQHCVAVTTASEKAQAFGVNSDNIFTFWDWVGGRYSLWSSVGLASMLAIGVEQFDALLAGAQAMDTHFESTALSCNWPVLMALVGIWNINFLNRQALLIAPYNHGLRYFPAYLQQLEMESNGKSVTLQGERVDYQTAPVVWGGAAINGQHAYFQMLHQGSRHIPIDFVLALQSEDADQITQRNLIASCLAQAAAMMQGFSESEIKQEMLAQGYTEEEANRLAPHRTFTGNRPSTLIALDTLNAYSLGSLLALYEHKVFVQSIVWNINAFDQWGVELGKRLTQSLSSALESSELVSNTWDASTQKMLTYVRQKRTGHERI